MLIFDSCRRLLSIRAVITVDTGPDTTHVQPELSGHWYLRLAPGSYSSLNLWDCLTLITEIWILWSQEEFVGGWDIAKMAISVMAYSTASVFYRRLSSDQPCSCRILRIEHFSSLPFKQTHRVSSYGLHFCHCSTVCSLHSILNTDTIKVHKKSNFSLDITCKETW